MRSDEIGPRRLRPPQQDRFLFPLVKERRDRVLKATMGPVTTDGTVNGVVTGLNAPAPEQLKLVISKGGSNLYSPPNGDQKKGHPGFTPDGKPKHATQMTKEWAERQVTPNPPRTGDESFLKKNKAEKAVVSPVPLPIGKAADSQKKGVRLMPEVAAPQEKKRAMPSLSIEKEEEKFDPAKRLPLGVKSPLSAQKSASSKKVMSKLFGETMDKAVSRGSELHSDVNEAEHPHSTFHPPMPSFSGDDSGLEATPHGVSASSKAAHYHALHTLHSGQAALHRERSNAKAASDHEDKADQYHGKAHEAMKGAMSHHMVKQAHHDLANYHLHRAVQTKGKESKTHQLMAYAHHQARQKPSHGGSVGHHEMSRNMVWGHRKIFGGGKAKKPENIKTKAGVGSKYRPSRWFGAKETGLAFGGGEDKEIGKACDRFMTNLILKAAPVIAAAAASALSGKDEPGAVSGALGQMGQAAVDKGGALAAPAIPTQKQYEQVSGEKEFAGTSGGGKPGDGLGGNALGGVAKVAAPLTGMVTKQPPGMGSGPKK